MSADGERFFVARRNHAGEFNHAVTTYRPRLETKEARKDTQIFALTADAARLELDVLILAFRAGTLQKNPRLVIPDAAPAKKPGERAAPKYREPRRVFATPIAAAWAIGKALVALGAKWPR